MQSKREWLVSKGLAKEGARGRFSLAAKQALEDAEKSGVTFNDVKVVKQKPETVNNPLTPTDIQIIVEKPVRNLGEELLGYTRGGYKFGFSNCRACGKNINYCKCTDGIVAPEIIDELRKGSQERIVRK